MRSGIVSHRDSLGNIGQTREGDVQVMSAGAGIRYEEGNAHQVPTKLFQIWIKPRETGGTPTWGTRRFPKADRAGHFSVLASGYPEDTDALTIRADARVLGATLRRRQTAKRLSVRRFTNRLSNGKVRQSCIFRVGAQCERWVFQASLNQRLGAPTHLTGPALRVGPWYRRAAQ